jgi:hypothetical protein
LEIKILADPPRIYSTILAKVYPLSLAKAQKKGRTKTEVDQIIRWLTGYSQAALEAQLEKKYVTCTVPSLLSRKTTLNENLVFGLR